MSPASASATASGSRSPATGARRAAPRRSTPSSPPSASFRCRDAADFELGASVGIPAVTAHRALTVAEDGPTRLHPDALSGRVVLVAGGAGAVGNAAIQLARWAGATVIATVSGDAKAKLAAAAGAHHVFNYRDADAAEQIRDVAPDGVDVIVEVAAGANAELDQAVLRPRGTISIYANDGAVPFNLDVRRNMGLNARYQFVLLYTVGWDRIAAAAADINQAIEDGAFRVGEQAGLPLHRFALEDARAAHAAVESGAVGKVLDHRRDPITLRLLWYGWPHPKMPGSRLSPRGRRCDAGGMFDQRHLPCPWRARSAGPRRRRLPAVSRLPGLSSSAPVRGSRAGATL